MMLDNSSNDDGSSNSLQPHRIPRSITAASRDELDSETSELQIVDGELPKDLHGHLFMAAALPYGDGTPILNGDGMIYRFDFSRDAVRLKTRIAKTPCYYADQATSTNNQYKKYAFHNAGLTRLGLLGSRNQVNTAFLSLNERLLVTFDAGRPYEIDPETLEVLTPVGANHEWIAAAPPIIARGPFPTFFSVAHPSFDAHADEMFTVNYRNLVSQLPQPISWGARKFIKNFDDFTDLIRWKGEGELERWRLELPDGSPVVIKQSLHQIGVTRDYVVLMDAGFRIELGQILSLFLINIVSKGIPVPDFIERLVFSRFLPLRRQLPYTALYIVRRADLQQSGGSVEEPRRLQARKVVFEPEAAHFIMDYENPSGHITLHLAHNCAWDATEWLHKGSKPAYSSVPIRKELHGMIVGPMDINRLGRYVIDGESGTVLESHEISDLRYTWSPSLYTQCAAKTSGQIESIYWSSWGFSWELLTKRVYKSYKNYKHRQIPLERLPNVAQPVSLLHLDTASMQIVDGYQFSAGRFISSPQFVPRRESRGGSNDGYIVCVVLSDDERSPGLSKDEVWIFDADNLAQGPVCRLELRSMPELPSFSFGLTLHTTWLAEIKQRTSIYHISVTKDYEELVKNQPQEVKDLFEKEVFPHFRS